MIRFLILTMALLLSVPAQAFSNYVQSPPLSQIIDSQVNPVQEGVTVVPIITWGGDIATIYANGNSKITTKNSIFAQNGLKLQLIREDNFVKQVANYMNGKTPYLRGTMGMINMAAEVAGKFPQTKPVVIYQMTWSAGGDAIVAKGDIKKAKDLCGKTIAMQRYGPHVDYLSKILTDAGCSIDSVNIKWMQDLTGTDKSPMVAFQQDATIHAAMVIIPDALALTSGGNVGTGAEDSVKSAHILMSTKSANRIIADVYAVRSDYFKTHRSQVEAFVNGLMKGEEALRKIWDNNRKETVAAAGQMLLDSSQAIEDVEGLYLDCEYVGYTGNVKFFTDARYPRNIDKLTQEIQSAYIDAGLLSNTVALAKSNFDYDAIKRGITKTTAVSSPRFNADNVARVVARKAEKKQLDSGAVFSEEIFFAPNQRDFDASQYQNAFDDFIAKAFTYGGAIITIEGHADPNRYLHQKKSGSPAIILKSTIQGAKNLSIGRANKVRDAIISYAKEKGTTLDVSQFAVIGHGISNPNTGMCGNDPCAPKTEAEWLSNMRVVFQVIPIEAEESVFQPIY
ncbi:MAG: ABC transporter substrate-binding protein [Mariprofundales bacterium]